MRDISEEVLRVLEELKNFGTYKHIKAVVNTQDNTISLTVEDD